MKAWRKALMAGVALVAVGYVGGAGAAESWRIPVPAFPPAPQNGAGAMLRLVNPHEISTRVVEHGFDADGKRYPATGGYAIELPANGGRRVTVAEIAAGIVHRCAAYGARQAEREGRPEPRTGTA